MKRFMRVYLTLLMMLTTFQSAVQASSGAYVNATDGSRNVISFKVGVILDVISWFGYAIALGMFIYIGIKYMMSAANEKANVKQGLINYLMGAVFIACASLIADIISSVAATGGNPTASTSANSIAQGIIDAAQAATE